MDKNSADEGHYNNIVHKRLAGEISLEDAAKPCDTTCRVDVTLCNNWEICLKVARSLVQCSTDFYFWQWLQAQKIVRNFCARVSYTREFLSCNLCCKNIVRQVAQKNCPVWHRLYNLQSSSSMSLHSSSSRPRTVSIGSRNVAGAKPWSPLEFATSHQPRMDMNTIKLE